MQVYFTADTHFGHGAARAFYRRPFASLAETDAAIIERWNAIVTPDDEVWHLGDVAVGPTPNAVAAILAALNGRKRLVRGNNDPDDICALPHWSSVHDLTRIEQDGVRATLCHYPLRSWPDQHRGALNLHGHSHGRLKPLTRQYDVGVDARDLRPVTLAMLGSGWGSAPNPAGGSPPDPST